ncbi:MAG: hypothetical protein ABIK36_06395 [Pseudomonadota bacterium]
MPVRKRTNKRSDFADAWDEIFVFGFDMLHRAYMAGIQIDEQLEPDRDEARAAWRLYGERFLESQTGEAEPWALSEFGDPRRRKDASSPSR